MPKFSLAAQKIWVTQNLGGVQPPSSLRPVRLCLFLNLSEVSKNSTPWKFAYIWHFQRIRINTTKFEETRIHFKRDVFGAITVVDAKAPQAECEMVVNEIEVVYCSWQSTVSYCFSFYDARENVKGVAWRKMRVHVLMVWFLVDLLVEYMVSDGEMVEWQGEIQVMSGIVIWCESNRYLGTFFHRLIIIWVWGVEVRNNVR